MTTANTVLAAGLAPAHPALRWTPIDQPAGVAPAQHRRLDAESTACGLVGHLTLADLATAYCGTCFPLRR